jgi:hypothetical protein
MILAFQPNRPVTLKHRRAQTREKTKMPRSKFATKAYGPTKPAICENQQLPPGTLFPGPGASNAAHFLLDVSSTNGANQPVAGTAVISRTGTPDRYSGSVSVGQYQVTIVLTATATAFAPIVDFYVYWGTDLVRSGQVSALAPRSIDPYDTGILPIDPPTHWGQQMIRIVARA